MIKIATIFLVVMMILALLGRFRIPGRRKLATRKCPACGRYRIGRSRCDCRNGRA